MIKTIVLIFSILFLSSKAFALGTPGTPIPTDTTAALDCDTLYLKSGKTIICSIISDNGTTVQFTDCPPSEIVSSIAKSATKLSPRDSALAAKRATLCDTIFIAGGEIVYGHVKYYNSRKVAYTGCCLNCTTEKFLKRKSVDSIRYADGRRIGTKGGDNYVANNPQTDPVHATPKVVEPEVVYTEEEITKFKKRSKLLGIFALISAGLALTGLTLVVAVSSATTAMATGFGLIFFGFVLAAIIFAGFRIRNRKRAGLKKKEKA